MDWKIVLLHTRQTTLLQRMFEAAFPGRVVSLFVPELARERKHNVRKDTLMDYFRREVHDSGIWSDRVMTIYGDGDFHHWTYALTKLALERRGLGYFDWTYFHFDQHRDDWGSPGAGRFQEGLDCACFVDQIAHDHQGIPFFVGPECYPKKDATGYQINGTEIPIYSNYFTKKLQRSKAWHNNVRRVDQTGLELPVTADLRATPTPSYLSFDLDFLSRSEIVTNFDQNDDMTLRRACQILDKIRPHKKVFSADILGFPDKNKYHALSCLTMIILARKVMGLGVSQLLEYHTLAKRRQAAEINRNSYACGSYWEEGVSEDHRRSPIEEGELSEVLDGNPT